MIVWTHAVLSVLYACVLYFCICTCSAQMSKFQVKRRSRNTLIIIITFSSLLCFSSSIPFSSMVSRHCPVSDHQHSKDVKFPRISVPAPANSTVRTTITMLEEQMLKLSPFTILLHDFFEAFLM